MSNLHLNKTVLLMVGRTGNGKSSTGNYIAGKHIFEVKGGFGESEVNECKTETIEYQGQKVTIVDGVSIYDTDYEDTTRIKKNVQECLVKCGHYVTAIFIVLRYGSRFTNQERQAIDLIKILFGNESIKNIGIIIFTFGDNFNEDKSIYFKDWLNRQQGDFKKLLEEVKYRCVLLNNKDVHDPQNVKEMFEYVENFKKNNSYNYCLFLLNDKREQLESYQKQFQHIKEDNSLSKKRDETNVENYILCLEGLLKKLDKFKESVDIIIDTNNIINDKETEYKSNEDINGKQTVGSKHLDVGSSDAKIEAMTVDTKNFIDCATVEQIRDYSQTLMMYCSLLENDIKETVYEQYEKYSSSSSSSPTCLLS